MEIGVLRDLLPLSESARVRLSQLQIMSLSCVYIRKCSILERVFGDVPFNISTPFDFFQALSGFMLVTTHEGKLVYISENVTEHLGHSMVDMKMQGDSVYDIIDKRDHMTVQAQLAKSETMIASGNDVSFFCRMNTSRCVKRQASPADIKIMHVKGHFKAVPSCEPSRAHESLFVAMCSPLLTPDVKENTTHSNTMIFKTTHSLDMKFQQASQNCKHHLGLSEKVLVGQSWYSLIHPDDIHEARDRHLQLVSSQSEQSCLLTIRMISKMTECIWLNVVMSMHHSHGHHCTEPSIVCINQVISEQEASQFKMHSHVYNMYQSREIDMLYNNSFSSIASTPTNILDNFMDQVSEQTSSAKLAHGGYNPALVPVTRSCVSGGNPSRNVTSVRKIEHAHTMKALKRKLGENALSPLCKSSKIMCGSPESSCGDVMISGGLSVSFNNTEIEQPSSLMSPVSPAFGFDMSNTQVATSLICQPGSSCGGVQHPPSLTSLEPLQQIVLDVAGMSGNGPEQVVPDWYLSPEASPTGSPNTFTDADVYAFAKSLDMKLKMEFKTEATQENSCVYAKKVPTRELPIIDPSVIDEFFDQVTSPPEYLPHSPPPYSRSRTESGGSTQVTPDNYAMPDDLLDWSAFLSADVNDVKRNASVTFSGSELISQEEAQATLSLLNLPALLVAPHRNMLEYHQRMHPDVLSLSHAHGVDDRVPVYERAST